MSNETLISIVITVIFGVAGLVFAGKKFSNNINQKTKNGNNTISNNTIGNEINNKKK